MATRKLKTLVIRFDLAVDTDIALPSSTPMSDTEMIGAETMSSLAKQAFVASTEDLSDGERGEVEQEKSTVGTFISMPFTKIEPFQADADGGQSPEISWGIETIGATEVAANAGEGVRVAVLDTGIAPDHPAFEGVNPIQKNFTEEVENDIDGHGTHCAGTIFGQDVNGTRIGIARGIREPLIGKVLGEGGGDSESIFQAIEWARREGAHIISMSLGMDFPKFRDRLAANNYHPREATSLALTAYRENIRLFDKISSLFSIPGPLQAPLMIAAAGNESRRDSYTISVAPPAAADDILSVGAIEPDLQTAKFSNTSPNCCAPGVNIWSADIEGGVKRLSGTSMATPHVAGIAALRAQGLINAGDFSPRNLRDELLGNIKKLAGLTRRDVGAGIPTI